MTVYVVCLFVMLAGNVAHATFYMVKTRRFIGDRSE